MTATHLQDWLRGWGRILLIPALLGVVWLLAGPAGEERSTVALGGPHLATGTAANATRSTPDHRRPRHVVVHVAGAVRRPGVYRVAAPGRLIDAVQRAGGLLPGADLTQINLAARLTDGRAIIVPTAGGVPGASAGGGAAAGTPPAPSGIKLNVNTATAEQLDALDGVGPAMAAAIIQERAKRGGFTSLDQLDAVSGIGERRLAALRQQLEL